MLSRQLKTKLLHFDKWTYQTTLAEIMERREQTKAATSSWLNRFKFSSPYSNTGYHAVFFNKTRRILTGGNILLTFQTLYPQSLII
jgi:hypothetical protein